MNDSDLIKQFIAIERRDDKTVIRVKQIFWQDPSDPSSSWIDAVSMALDASQEQLESAIMSILDDNRYFSVCHECKERNPIGWMHDSKICQACAQKNHGVVY